MENFTLDNIKVDVGGNRLLRGDLEVRVEPKVMRLLCCLAAHAGDVVGRNTLLDTVWAGQVVEDDALTGAVIKLRKALADNARQPRFIVTVPKVGYRLLGPVRPVSPTTPRSQQYGSTGWNSEAGISAGLDLTGINGPALAVLPFRHANEDVGQSIFVDGFTEDLVCALSASRSFPVIASNATRVYNDPSRDRATAGQELGARYVVDGSLRQTRSNLKLTVSLTDAVSGTQLWSGRYDRGLDGLFDLQDELVTRVVDGLEVHVSHGEMRRALNTAPADLDAYLLLQRATWRLWQFSKEAFVEARREIDEALALDEGYARAHAVAAQAHLISAIRDYERPASAYARALEHGNQALLLDGDDPVALRYLGGATTNLGRLAKGKSLLGHAIERYPSYATAYSALAFALCYTGEFEEAMVSEATTARLRPNDPRMHFCMMSSALASYQIGDYEKAVQICEDSRSYNSQLWLSALVLCAALGMLGRREATLAPAEVVRDCLPSVSQGELFARLPFAEARHREHLLEGLAKSVLAVDE